MDMTSLMTIPDNSLTATIGEFIRNKALFASEASFTGVIIKPNQRQQIIVKNFAKKCDPYYPYKRYSTPAVASTVQTAQKIGLERVRCSCIPLFLANLFKM